MKTTFTDTLKEHSKAVTAGAVVAVLALGGGVYTLTQGKEEAKPVEAKIVTSTSSSSDKKAKQAKADKALLDDAEKKVVILEKNQVTENVSPAQKATDKVTDADKKDTLQKRIDTVVAAIGVREAQARDLAEAERLVKALEDNQVAENISPAQTATDKVADEPKKGALQARIQAVTQAIQAREAEAAQAQATAQAAAQSYEEPSEVSQTDNGSYQVSGGSDYQAPTYDAHTQAVLNAPTDQAAVDISSGPDRPKDYSWAAGR